MRILITGATGLFGKDLCRALAGRHTLIGWSRRPAQIPGVQMESVDLMDEEGVRSGMSRCRPDWVIHSAAWADVDACERDPKAAWRMNGEAAGRVARACAQNQAGLMAIGTDYVFDGNLGRPYREEDPTNPVNAYGRSKLEGERQVLAAGPRCLVVRVSGLFGAGRANFVTDTVEKLRKGESIPVVTDQRYTPSYTLDLAEGIGKLLEKAQRLKGIFHLSNGGGASRSEVAGEVARWMGIPNPPLRPTTWREFNRPARRPADSRLDCPRYAQATGSALRPWPEALVAFLESEVGRG